MSLQTGAYRCLLSRGEPCTALAVVQIRDADGSHTRGCVQHAVQALRAVDGSRVVWTRTHVTEMGRLALEMQEGAVGRR